MATMSEPIARPRSAATAPAIRTTGSHEASRCDGRDRRPGPRGRLRGTRPMLRSPNIRVGSPSSSTTPWSRNCTRLSPPGEAHLVVTTTMVIPSEASTAMTSRPPLISSGSSAVTSSNSMSFGCIARAWRDQRMSAHHALLQPCSPRGRCRASAVRTRPGTAEVPTGVIRHGRHRAAMPPDVSGHNGPPYVRWRTRRVIVSPRREPSHCRRLAPKASLDRNAPHLTHRRMRRRVGTGRRHRPEWPDEGGSPWSGTWSS